MPKIPDDTGEGKGQRTKGGYDAKLYGLAGGYFPSATLLRRIFYWWPRATIKHGGYTWIAKSHDEWCEETGLSKQQCKDGLARLRRLGLVVTERHLFANKPVTHLRLTEAGEAALASTAPSAQGQTTPNAQGQMTPNARGQMTPNPEGQTTLSHIHSLTSESYNTEDSSDVHTGVLAHAPGSGIPHEQKDSGEDENQGENESNKVSPDHKGKTDTLLIDLEYMWRQIVGEEHDTLVPRFTPQQRGQLRQFVERCPKSQARAVIETCLRDWCYFARDAERKAGAFKCPDQPELGFLLRYIEPAVNFYLDEVKRCARQREWEAKQKARDQEVKAKAAAAKAPVQTIATPSPSEPVKTKPTKPEYPADDPPASYEEVMEILEMPGSRPKPSTTPDLKRSPSTPKPATTAEYPEDETWPPPGMMETLNSDNETDEEAKVLNIKLPLDDQA